VEGLILQVQQFLLVVIRVGCILFFFPLWDSKLIPSHIKVYSILVIAAALTPVVAPTLPPFPQTWPGMAALVLRELLLGLSLGLVVLIVFSGVHMAGELLGMQMGFAMVSLIDPNSGAPISVIADLLVLTATTLFLAVNGHHLLLAVLAQSFTEVPVGGTMLPPGNVFALVVPLSRIMFQLAIKVVAPVLLVLFLAQVAMGLVARVVPQVQVMILSFPLTIALGLLFLSLTLMVAGPYLAGRFAWFETPLLQVLKAWQG
jgi:flagellar biosynthetic protein FliR